MSCPKNDKTHKLLLFLVTSTFCFEVSQGDKLQYASATECDRYSLDAVYYEKFKLITRNIFRDCIEFVSRVSDLVAESLTSIMAGLPDRHVSGSPEKKIFTQFKNLKQAFSSRVRKAHRNITTSWEALVNSSFDLLSDNGKSSLQDYLNKTLKMTDAYSEARKSLDTNMETFVSFVKKTVRDGMQGISMAAEQDITREEKEQAVVQKEDEKNKSEETKEEKIQKKKIEITEMIVQGFLKKITVEVLKQKMDLFKKPDIRPEDRDSVLDDLIFDITMIKSRIRAIIHPDIPKEKGSINLTRRSIYTYWAGLADTMYKEKSKAKKSTGSSAYYYKQLWKDENQLTETLLDLMVIYP